MRVKKLWELFEDCCKESFIESGYSVQKILTGCKIVGDKSRKLPQTRTQLLPNVFDFFATKNNNSFFFDAKLRNKAYLSYSAINNCSSTMHQAQCLSDITRKKSFGFFLVCFTDNVYLFLPDQLLELKPGESLKSYHAKIECGDFNYIDVDKIEKYFLKS